MFTTPSRVLHTALQQMRRHGWHTVAALSVISLTFFVITLFVLTALASTAVLRFIEQQPDLTIYIKDDVPAEKVDELKLSLENTGLVKSASYLSKEQALEEYRDLNKNNPILLESLSSNILPASLGVLPNKLEDLDQLAEIAQDKKYADVVDSVQYQQKLVERLGSWMSAARIIGLGLVTFLIIVSFLIMLTVIGMNIASYQQEIEVMRLVGASNWYIRGPFVVEGILYGAIAAVLSVGVVYLALPWLKPTLDNWLQGVHLFPIPVLTVFGGTLLFELLLGVLLGVLGAVVAMRRSLKV